MNLKEARESRGVKKCAAASHLGVSLPTYDKYERNPDVVSVGQARKIARFLGVKASDIFLLDD